MFFIGGVWSTRQHAKVSTLAFRRRCQELKGIKEAFVKFAKCCTFKMVQHNVQQQQQQLKFYYIIIVR